MRNIYLSILLIIIFCNSQAQVVDSMLVRVTSTRVNTNFSWFNPVVTIDSLSSGVLIAQVGQIWNLNHWEYQSKYIYSYSGLDTTIEFSDWTNNAWRPRWKSVFEHNSGYYGKSFYKWNNAWEFDHSIESHFDTLTNNVYYLLETYSSIPQDFITRHYYDYDSLGRIVIERIIKLSDDQTTWETTNILNWYYDSLGHNIVSYNYEFNDMGDTLGVMQYISQTDSLNRPYWSFSNIYDLLTHQFNPYNDTTFSQYLFIGDTARTIRTMTDNSGIVTAIYVFDTLRNASNQLIYYAQSSHDPFTNFEWKNVCNFGFNLPNSLAFIDVKVRDTIYVCNNSIAYTNITAFGGYKNIQYQWSPSSEVSDDTLAVPQILSTSDHYLYYTATDSLNQVISDSVYIAYVIAPVISSITNTGTSCIGCSNGSTVLNVDIGTLPLNNFSYTNGNFNVNQSATRDTIKNLAADVYNVCIYDIVGCFSCINDTILEDPTIISSIVSQSDLVVYPNPSNKWIRILNGSDFSEIQVINSLGQKVISKSRQLCDSFLDVSSLSKGWYIVRANMNGYFKQTRLIIE